MIFHEIVVQIIAGILVFIITTYIISLIKPVRQFIKHIVLNFLTSGILTDVLDYSQVLVFIQNKLKGKNHINQLKILAFMGKNLVREPGLLDDIKNFLSSEGKVIFILSDPLNPFISHRYTLINKSKVATTTEIKNVHTQIIAEYQTHFPNQVTLKVFKGPIWFKFYFLENFLVIGFYTKIRSYKNKFLLVKRDSVLYKIAEIIWEYYENNSTSIPQNISQAQSANYNKNLQNYGNKSQGGSKYAK